MPHVRGIHTPSTAMQDITESAKDPLLQEEVLSVLIEMGAVEDLIEAARQSGRTGRKRIETHLLQCGGVLSNGELPEGQQLNRQQVRGESPQLPTECVPQLDGALKSQAHVLLEVPCHPHLMQFCGVQSSRGPARGAQSPTAAGKGKHCCRLCARHSLVVPYQSGTCAKTRGTG